VIAALSRLQRKHPRLTKVASFLAYFRKNRRRVRYAQRKREGYMIGCGVVEAACKTPGRSTPQAQRHALGNRRGPGRFTMRGWDQSERFDEAWAPVAATRQREVHVLANVVESRRKRHTGSAGERHDETYTLSSRAITTDVARIAHQRGCLPVLAPIS
jgi:hypothetical protein